MSVLDLLVFAASNLSRHKVRTALTVLGVAVGSGAIVLLVSFGIGLKTSMVKQFETSELLTSITVLPSKTESLFRRRRLRGDEPRLALTDDVVKSLGDIPGVTDVYPEVMAVLEVEIFGKKDILQVVGLPRERISVAVREAALAGEPILDGRAILFPSYLLESFGLSSPREAVGAPIHFLRGSRRTAPGEDLPEKVEATIAAVFESEKLGMAGLRAYASMELTRELARLMGFHPMLTTSEGEYRALTVRVASMDDVETVRKEIDARGYGTLTVTDLVRQIQSGALILEGLLAGLGGIGLLVAFFGIVNTMLMAALERRREIGILKAIGARNRDIRRMFFFEAGVIGVAGGLLGVAGGWLAGAGVGRIARGMIESQGGPKGLELSVVSPLLAVLAASFAVLVALLAGLYPALRAGSVDPIAAIRAV